jgi:polar amino acid transport system substrate-binding protein
VRSNDLPELTIVTEHLAPFQIQNTDGSLSGLSIEVINELFKVIAIEPNIRIMPWARAYEIAKQKSNVLIFSIAHTPQRSAKFHWLGCITEEKFSFWGLKSHYQNISYNIEQLKDEKVAISRYSNVEQYLTEKKFNNILRLVQQEQNIQMLFSARVDLIVATELTVKHRAKRLGLNPQKLVKVHSADELNNKICIALSLGTDSRWLRHLRSAFRQLENNGTIFTIRQKWLTSE